MSNVKLIYSISACSWLLLGLYLILSVQKFIVKRYEQETKLSETKFFNEILPFTKHLPAFFRSSVYACHLILFVWGWNIVIRGKEKKNIRYYDDIDASQDVTKHFSKKEIQCVKMEIITLLIITFHVVGVDILEWVKPGIFD